jgi:ketosteroid isomerase-like protein
MHAIPRALLAAGLLALAVGGCAGTPPAVADRAALEAEVAATERAFAKTMADRDHAAFTRFLADEAVFFGPGPVPLRGKPAVAEAWRGFYTAAAAPFSWEPDEVVVLDSGTLALSTGPVRNPAGKVVSRYQSIWRRESSGTWRIVFDKGSPVCPSAPSP